MRGRHEELRRILLLVGQGASTDQGLRCANDAMIGLGNVARNRISCLSGTVWVDFPTNFENLCWTLPFLSLNSRAQAIGFFTCRLDAGDC